MAGGKSATSIVFGSVKIITLSITLRSSRIFPGQSYSFNISIASGEIDFLFLPETFKLSKKKLTNKGMSSGLSLKGGTFIVTTLKR